MAIHKLVMDDVFENECYTLIAIHCSIEDYRLAYLLNKRLNISLNKKQKDLDFNNGAKSYSIYEWINERQLITWNLVSNICKKEVDSSIDYQSLFSTQQKIIKTHYLVPEYDSVNYFLKIDCELTKDKETYIINNLLKILHIRTAYKINASLLKSKENLIFN